MLCIEVSSDSDHTASTDFRQDFHELVLADIPKEKTEKPTVQSKAINILLFHPR